MLLVAITIITVLQTGQITTPGRLEDVNTSMIDHHSIYDIFWKYVVFTDWSGLGKITTNNYNK